jgi:hypothetical protein
MSLFEMENMNIDLQSELEWLENNLLDLKAVLSPEYLRGFNLEEIQVQHALKLISDSIESINRIKTKY